MFFIFFYEKTFKILIDFIVLEEPSKTRTLGYPSFAKIFIEYLEFFSGGSLVISNSREVFLKAALQEQTICQCQIYTCFTGDVD